MPLPNFKEQFPQWGWNWGGYFDEPLESQYDDEGNLIIGFQEGEQGQYNSGFEIVDENGNIVFEFEGGTFGQDWGWAMNPLTQEWMWTPVGDDGLPDYMAGIIIQEASSPFETGQGTIDSSSLEQLQADFSQWEQDYYGDAIGEKPEQYLIGEGVETTLTDDRPDAFDISAYEDDPKYKPEDEVSVNLEANLTPPGLIEGYEKWYEENYPSFATETGGGIGGDLDPSLFAPTTELPEGWTWGWAENLHQWIPMNPDTNIGGNWLWEEWQAGSNWNDLGDGPIDGVDINNDGVIDEADYNEWLELTEAFENTEYYEPPPGAGEEVGVEIGPGTPSGYSADDFVPWGIEDWRNWLSDNYGDQWTEELAAYLYDMYSGLSGTYLEEQGAFDNINSWLSQEHIQDEFFVEYKRPEEEGLTHDDNVIGELPTPVEQIPGIPEDELPFGYEWVWNQEAGEWIPEEVMGGYDYDYWSDQANWDFNNDGMIDMFDIVSAQNMGLGDDVIELMENALVDAGGTIMMPGTTVGADEYLTSPDEGPVDESDKYWLEDAPYGEGWEWQLVDGEWQQVFTGTQTDLDLGGMSDLDIATGEYEFYWWSLFRS